MSLPNDQLSPVNYPKPSRSGTYPLYINSPTGLLTRIEPFLTPELFRSRFLVGMEKIFALAGFHPTDEQLKDWINIGINEFEVLTDVLFFAERKTHTMPLDANLSRNWMFTKLPNAPVLTLLNMSLTSADGSNIFQLPAQWVSMDQAQKGIITVIPLMAAANNSVVAASTSSPYAWPFYGRLLGFSWIPAFLLFDYTTGMCADLGQVPVIANELLGVLVTLRILAMLLVLFPYVSQALSQDSISQSSSLSSSFVSSRIQLMEARKVELIGQIKRLFSSKYYLSNI